ncbi:MAG: hypothetical protein N2F24_09595 [Deltaproteobacteria bacterium]
MAEDLRKTDSAEPAAPDAPLMREAMEFLELECNSAMGSLLRKFEKPQPKGKPNAASPHIQ